MPTRLALVVLLAVVGVSVCHGARTMVVGHRGDSGIAPENTMPAFELAISNGADGVETDLQVTKDGVIVLLHDATLDRTTNCSGNIADWNFGPEAPSLETCDAGSWFGPEFAGTRIPSLAQLLEYAGTNNMSIVLDMKDTGAGIGQMLKTLLDKHGMQGRCVASCWNFDQIAEVVAFLNITAKQGLAGSLDPWHADPSGFLDFASARGVEGWSVNKGDLNHLFVAQAHERLMGVNAWTVDDPKDIQRMLEIGVDGILTDYVTRVVDMVAAFEHPDTPVAASPSKGVDQSTFDAVLVVLLLAITFLVAALVFVLWRSKRRSTAYQDLDLPERI